MSTDDEISVRDVLTYALLQNIQNGIELSTSNWEWLYSRAIDPPARLEQFKTDLIARVRNVPEPYDNP
jgi:hypothetical protein